MCYNFVYMKKGRLTMPKWHDQTAGIIPRQIITEFLGAGPIHPAQGSCCAVADKDVF